MTDIEQEASAEAEKRWARPGGASHPAIRTPREWLDEGMASGFVLGAQWAASRPASPARETVTEEMVERAARALYEATRGAWEAWEEGPFPEWQQFADKDCYRRDARLVLEAVLAEKGDES